MRVSPAFGLGSEMGAAVESQVFPKSLPDDSNRIKKLILMKEEEGRGIARHWILQLCAITRQPERRSAIILPGEISNRVG